MGMGIGMGTGIAQDVDQVIGMGIGIGSLNTSHPSGGEGEQKITPGILIHVIFKYMGFLKTWSLHRYYWPLGRHP